MAAIPGSVIDVLCLALLHGSNLADMASAVPLSVSNRVRLRCTELEDAVEYVASKSSFSLLVAWLASAEPASEELFVAEESVLGACLAMVSSFFLPLCRR